MKKLIPLLLITLCIYAEKPILDDQVTPTKSPEQITAELQSAEAQFNYAKKMFNPWYTGPLITPSASMVPPGSFMIQPYIYFFDNYAQFNEDRHSESISNLLTLKPQAIFQFGVTKTMDVTLAFSGVANWQHGQTGGGFNDLGVTVGFPIYFQTLYVPQIKFTIQETFPTGKYENLSANGLNLSGSGAGSYQTQFGLGLAKLFFWSYQHPINTRLFVGYVLPSKVSVSGFNVYGGGYGTDGTVTPGNTLNADFGIEYSITQPWVLALDVVYTATNKTKFSGYPGLTSAGTLASVGSGYNDNLSLAPALEYNWNENLGVIGGVWFSVYGRNSLNFVSALFSVCYVFGG